MNYLLFNEYVDNIQISGLNIIFSNLNYLYTPSLTFYFSDKDFEAKCSVQLITNMTFTQENQSRILNHLLEVP